ncbi:chalcone isomerase family protein [Vibrio sp. VB16]|uniref:chalcone isomerase family protein n=1 Tax=Vibrio sp. VB16 TaxID=2785746 RepID=UPI00189F4AB5|nr:chalcone isomerase family protein [Vibrio sp. VB16]UGA56594.1 chalcone isomerase family protein [Vibrio sp. VB16]
MKIWTLVLLLLTASVSASPISHLNKVGEGEMTYLFWTIYQAEFYRGVEQEKDNAMIVILAKDENEKALKIEYFKSISKRALIDATIDQWQHLGYRQNNIDKWAAPLERIWPDVEPGNTITIRVRKNGQSQFFFNDAPIGAIDSQDFGDAFLSIWLSENTSEPKLRQQLLGLNQ